METSPGLTPHLPAQRPPLGPERDDDALLMEAARQLEASFLAEMLKQAGFADGRSAFGGGAGEQQFSSFLLDEYAKKIVSSGGIGLAEKIFQHLHART